MEQEIKSNFQLFVTSPSPWLVDDIMQRLPQRVGRHTVEVEDDSGAAATEAGDVIWLICEQRDSDQWHGVIHGLIQTVGATMSHKRSGLWVTYQEQGFYC